jgi:hypothetical protein
VCFKPGGIAHPRLVARDLETSSSAACGECAPDVVSLPARGGGGRHLLAHSTALYYSVIPSGMQADNASIKAVVGSLWWHHVAEVREAHISSSAMHTVRAQLTRLSGALAYAPFSHSHAFTHVSDHSRHIDLSLPVSA